MPKNPSPPNNGDEDVDPDEGPRHCVQNLALDLGDDSAGNVETNRLDGQEASDSVDGKRHEAATSSHKREDNPFSFKHFLRDSSNSSNRNYQSLGARPKVYGDGRSRTPPESPQRQHPRNLGEFSSALPDFVQDHLVIEQCFLGNKYKTSKSDVNVDLPDFTQEGQEMNKPNISRSNSIEDHHSPDRIPLDLPGLSSNNAFPLDLPIPSTEVGNSKSLPDFLTDGPVRNASDTSPAFLSDSHRGEPLRDKYRCPNCSHLTSEINSLRQRLDRTDDELEKNYRRAAAAENSVARLKLELKSLKARLRQAQAENEMLRDGGAAAAGGAGDPPLEVRLAHELRAAASTAEHSLRGLLTGVDNLRVMASTLENLNRIEEKPTPDRFSDFEGDNVGPAL